jgi:hypothetical protein
MTISSTLLFGIAENYAGFASIMFPRPLPPGHAPTVHFMPNGATSTECPRGGTEPVAEEGNLCVYGFTFSSTTEPTYFSSEERDESGDVLVFSASKPEGIGEGTWAMTAE